MASRRCGHCGLRRGALSQRVAKQEGCWLLLFLVVLVVLPKWLLLVWLPWLVLWLWLVLLLLELLLLWLLLLLQLLPLLPAAQ